MLTISWEKFSKKLFSKLETQFGIFFFDIDTFKVPD